MKFFIWFIAFCLNSFWTIGLYLTYRQELNKNPKKKVLNIILLIVNLIFNSTILGACMSVLY